MGIFTRTRRRHRIELLGAPSVGKTTLIYRLANQPVPDIVLPTAAPTLEKAVESPGGHKFIFSEQKEESEGASAIVYIMTWTDIKGGLKSLKQLIETGSHPTVPILVLVNKQDLAKNEKLEDIAAEIAPQIGTARSWGIRGCSALKDEGLDGVMTWFETQLPMY